MSNKKMYIPNDIVFGAVALNAGEDGYYTFAHEAFIKLSNEEGIVIYKKLERENTYTEFQEGTNKYATVSEIVELTHLMPAKKHNIPVSASMINLYLLKYKTKKLFKKSAYLEEVNNQSVAIKTKKR